MCNTSNDDLFNIEQAFYEIQGFKTDIKCHFYYDESNNCRKFWIKPNEPEKKFNVNPYEDFVLAGIVTTQDNIEVTFEELREALNLQKNVTEVKFKKHFAYSDFFSTMNRKRIGALFEWINKHNLLIHYLHINNFFYAIVDIIDSITTPDEIYENKLDYFEVKSALYDALWNKKELVQNLMFEYEYPNVKTEKTLDFILALLLLLSDCEPKTKELEFIIQKLEESKQTEELIFLQNNTDYVMQENYIEFYFDHPLKYFNSFHTFDEENKIQSIENDSEISYNGKMLINVEYVNSKNNVFIQVSDVIAGLWGKLMIYINNNDKAAIANDINNLTPLQISNINALGNLRMKSCHYNKGFLMSITAISVRDKIDFLFKQCHTKALEQSIIDFLNKQKNDPK